MTAVPGRSVVVLGTVALDVVARQNHDSPVGVAAGNSGSNIAIRLAAQGLDVQFCAVVGDDLAGAIVRSDLTRWGVKDDLLISRPGYRTPHVFQTLPLEPGAKPVFSNECVRCGMPQGTQQLPKMEEIGPRLQQRAQRADAVLSDLTGPVAVDLFADTSRPSWFEAGAAANSPHDSHALAACATVVKCAADEIDGLSGMLDGEDRQQIVVVTDGDAGYRFRTPGSSLWTSAQAQTAAVVVDTMGAGDAFTAGALASLMTTGWDSPGVVESALTAGARAAARACEYEGARGDMHVPGGSSPWSRSYPVACSYCIDTISEETSDER